MASLLEKIKKPFQQVGQTIGSWFSPKTPEPETERQWTPVPQLQEQQKPVIPDLYSPESAAARKMTIDPRMERQVEMQNKLREILTPEYIEVGDGLPPIPIQNKKAYEDFVYLQVEQQKDDLVKKLAVAKEALKEKDKLSKVVGVSRSSILGKSFLTELGGLISPKVEESTELAKEIINLGKAIKFYDDFLRYKDTDPGLFGDFARGMIDAVMEPEKLIPFARYAVSLEEHLDALSAAKKSEKGGKLTRAEESALEKYQAKDLPTKRRWTYIAGNMVATMPTFMAEFGMAKELVAKPVAAAVEKSAIGKATGALKIPVPKMIQKIYELPSHIGADKIISQIIGVSAQSGLLLAAKTPPDVAEAAIPYQKELQNPLFKDFYEEIGGEFEFGKVLAKKLLINFVDTFTEYVGDVIQKPVDFFAKATLGKWLANRGIVLTSSKAFSELAKSVNWDGVIGEVFEEEISYLLESKVEGEPYMNPFTTAEGIERLLVETLGIVAFAGLSRIPEIAVKSKINIQKRMEESRKAEVARLLKEGYSVKQAEEMEKRGGYVRVPGLSGDFEGREIEITKNTSFNDIYKNKIEIKKGDNIKLYETEGNNVVLEKGKENYIVSKGQIQNIEGKGVEAEIKPTAPSIDISEKIEGMKEIQPVEAEISKKTMADMFRGEIEIAQKIAESKETDRKLTTPETRRAEIEKMVVKETTLLKNKIKALSRGTKMGAMATKENIKSAQIELNKTINEANIPAEYKNKLKDMIKSLATFDPQKTLRSKMAEVNKRIAQYADTYQKKLISEESKERAKLAKEREDRHITMKETTLLKNKIKALARGSKIGAMEARENIKQAQTEMNKMINQADIPAKDKSKLKDMIKSVITTNPQETLKTKMNEISDRIVRYAESDQKKAIAKEIEREFKYTKPVKRGDRRVAKYHYEFNRTITGLRNIFKLSKSEANLRLQESLPIVEGGKVVEGVFSEMDKIRNRLYSLRAGGADASVELYKQVLNDIKMLKSAGELAKNVDEFIDKVERREQIKRIADISDKIKGDLRDAKFIDKVLTKMANFYRRGFSNLGSFLNSLFGKSIADEYDPETIENKKNTEVSKKTNALINELTKINGVENNRQFCQSLIDMAKDTTILTSKDGLKKDISRLQVLDIYNSVKNDVLKERYYNAYGQEQIDSILSTMTETEMDFGDTLMDISQDSRWIYNKRSIETTGLDLGFIENYWPATTEHSPNIYDDIRLQGETPSAMKHRSASTTLIPIPENAYYKTLKHIAQAEHVRFLSPEYEKLKRTFGDRQIKERLINKYGVGVYNDLMSHINIISLNKTIETANLISNTLDEALNKWTKAKIAVPTVFARQLGSMTNWAAHMPTGQWVKGFIQGIFTPKKTINYMLTEHPGIGDFLRARFNQGYDEASRDALIGLNRLKTKADSYTSIFTLGGRTGDITAIIAGGYPYVKYLEREARKKGLKGMEAEEYISTQFIKIALKTQQSGEGTGLSLAQNTRNPAFKLYFRFKNTNHQHLRQLVDSTIQYRRGEIDAKQLGKIWLHYGVIQPFFYVLIGNLVKNAFKGIGKRIFGGKREEEKDEFMEELAVQIMINPIAAIPIITDVIEFTLRKMVKVGGYQVISTPVLDDIERALRAATKAEVTLADFMKVISTPIEITTSIPTDAFLRYYKLVTGKDLFEKKKKPSPSGKSSSTKGLPELPSAPKLPSLPELPPLPGLPPLRPPKTKK